MIYPKNMYLYFLSIILSYSKANILIPQETSTNFLPECLNNLIGDSPESKYIYSNLDLQIEKPVIAFNPKESLILFKIERSDIFLLTDDSINTVLQKITQEPIFNPRSTVLVLSQEIGSTISTASKFHIDNLRVIKNHQEIQEIFSYQPYKSSNVNNPSLEYSLWGTCTNGTLSKSRTTFSSLIPRKWSNTTITALNNIIPPYTICPRCSINRGIEIDAFDIIAHRLQLQVKYTRDSFYYWGSKTNGSYSYILGELQRREGDMAIGVFHSKFDEHLDFDMTFTYMEDGTRWLVPKAKILPYWKRLSLVFSRGVYLILLLSISLMVVVCRFLYTCSYVSSWILLYQILLEVSLKQLPETFKTIIMIWIGSCLILSTVFKSKLVDIMSKNSYEHQISTIRDIVESGLEIVIDHDIARFYTLNNPAEEYIRKNYNYCPDPRTCINRTAFAQDCVTIDFMRSNTYFLPQFVDSEGDVLFYLFKTSIFPVHIHLFFVKGYPIFPQIDEMLMRMRAGGIIQHLYDDAGYSAKKAMSKKIIFKAEVLTLEQLEVAFFMWSLGILVSGMVFVGEWGMKVGWRRKRRGV